MSRLDKHVFFLDVCDRGAALSAAQTQQAADLEKRIVSAGGRVHQRFSSRVTHFVLLGNAAGKENAESSAAHRRALVMQSSGKPLQIVDLEWVEKQCCKEVAPTHDVSTRGKRTLQNPAVQQPTSTASSSSSPSTKKVKRETNERETVRTEEVKRETKMVKAYLKGRVAVDHLCPIAETAHVLEEGDEDIWDAMLNQTNIAQNNNKFYMIQLLEGDNQRAYYVWRRWGRVGQNGQTNLASFDGDIEAAKSSFRQKFMDKTRNVWEERSEFEHCFGKYDMLQRAYGDPAVVAEAQEAVKAAAPKREPPPCTLHERVQELLNMIFDLRMMSAAMVEIGYDARRMPLGQLTKEHIAKGYDILKEIAQILAGSFSTKTVELSRLSSRFYTIIPHDFGMRAPPIIKTVDFLREKLNMVEALGDIEIATTIVNQTRNEDHGDRHPLDAYYASLHAQISPLARDSDRWHLIDKYVQNTHAPTHVDYTLDVVDVYEVERDGERARFEQYAGLDNQTLLFHGSRLSNFVGILNQGLRIAPPEAPGTGYMFGKGVYFSDMATKSANYCFASRGNPYGLLVLCQVALGTMIDYTNANYDADKPVKQGRGHSSRGVGGTFPDPKATTTIEGGLRVPCGKPMEKKGHRGGLLYNEYIVYDTAQVQMKYVLKVKFNFRRGKGMV